jgi:hypothetical protein
MFTFPLSHRYHSDSYPIVLQFWTFLHGSRDMKYCTSLSTMFFTNIQSSTYLPFSNLRQWHNSHPSARYLVCPCVSLDPHSVPFGHLKICCTTQIVPSGLNLCNRKQSLTCNEYRPDSLLLLAEIWPPRGPQTWNNFQSHRPFCSLVKLRHEDGEQRH